MRELTLSPADTYIVVNKSIIDSDDRKNLTLLYQPIIGPLAIMLYFSLWDDLDESEIMSTEKNGYIALLMTIHFLTLVFFS